MALEFGTAGIRGRLGPGPEKMNTTTVRRVAQGMGTFLSSHLQGNPAIVVIGYDARHQSDSFARVAAEAISYSGHSVSILDHPLPTPVLAYTVRSMGADAGLMVTASHNPATDNGVKVYLGGRLTDDAGRGAQIVPPTDAAIQEAIDASIESGGTGGWSVIDGIESEYVDTISRLIPPPVGDTAIRRMGLSIVLTPLHGVGGATARMVLEAAGFTNVHVVPEQAEPDPDFPTVTFPNPEEPGAMGLAQNLAKRTHSDLVLALDPDADRCGLGAVVQGTLRSLTGDEVGSLLGEWIASRLASGESLPGVAPGSRTFARSIVSSRMLDAIASRYELPSVSTLTGFKWLSRVPGLAFAYEEALGYCVAPEVVRDKDGIAAGLVVAELASLMASHGRSLSDALDDLDTTYGVHLTRRIALRSTSESLPLDIVTRLMAHPPKSLGGSPVERIDDARLGLDGLPPTEGVRLVTASGTQVIIRPSGTESMVKAYLEVALPPSLDLSTARETARAAMDALEKDTRGVLTDSSHHVG